jgi:hypothetical protein
MEDIAMAPRIPAAILFTTCEADIFLLSFSLNLHTYDEQMKKKSKSH